MNRIPYSFPRSAYSTCSLTNPFRVCGPGEGDQGGDPEPQGDGQGAGARGASAG